VAGSVAVALSMLPAAAARTEHVRGIILGTTPRSLDIGIADRSDVHLDMAAAPHVLIAEPSDAGALAPGAMVTIATKGEGPGARAIGVLVVPRGLRAFAAGHASWDLPDADFVTTGIVVQRMAKHGTVDVTVAYPGGRRLIAISNGAPVVTLRQGSRAALQSPQDAFVVATPPTDGLSYVVQSVIVGDGTLVVPL